MTFATLRLAMLAGLALPFGLASASLAQDAPPAPPPGGDAGMHHGWGDHHDVDPAARRARMIQHLRDVLQLQPAQEAALTSFIDSMKPPGDMKPDMEHGPGDMAHLPTPERLDKMMARFDDMHARMLARIAATKQFYAQLSPSQQKAFDDLAPMMMMRHFGRDHGMMGHHHDGEGWGHPMGPGGQPST